MSTPIREAEVDREWMMTDDDVDLGGWSHHQKHFRTHGLYHGRTSTGLSIPVLNTSTYR